jgi:hypothetical protein
LHKKQEEKLNKDQISIYNRFKTTNEMQMGYKEVEPEMSVVQPSIWVFHTAKKNSMLSRLFKLSHEQKSFLIFGSGNFLQERKDSPETNKPIDQPENHL